MAGSEPMIHCNCGSPMYPDSFEHPRRAVEWFMRCPNCGEKGPSAPTFDESITAYIGTGHDTGEHEGQAGDG